MADPAAARSTHPPKIVLVIATLGLLLGPFTAVAGGHAPEAPAPIQAADEPSPAAEPIEVTDLSRMVLAASDPSRGVPQVADGFVLQPLAPVGVPTAISFGPGDDGPDLYATTLPGEDTGPNNAFAGRVVRVNLAWTPAGPVAESIEDVASGFQRPNGITVDDEGHLYVSDRVPNPATGRVDGRVTKLAPSDTHQSQGQVIVDGLPNGRHSTNHVRLTPDGETLLIPNGNPNDSGCNRSPNGTLQCRGGAADVFPISGALLAVDVSEVSQQPVEIEWTDDAGETIFPYDVWMHAVNDDAREKITVVASGFRNIYGITQAPADLPYGGSLYTAMNGADSPSSQDALYKLPELGSSSIGRNYTYPYCYPAGPAGGVGEQADTRINPAFQGHPAASCDDAPEPEALLGWHTCTTGLDFPHRASTGGAVPDFTFPEEDHSSVFVAECFHIFAQDWANQTSQDPANATHSTSHKVAQVVLDDEGHATRVQDFVTGLATPTDVQFGPDGAMYVADASGIHRVAPAPQEPIQVNTVPFQFVPQVLVVPQGTTMQWNGGLLGHTVSTGPVQCVNEAVTPAMCETNAGSGADTFHEPLPPGGSVTHTWQTTGYHAYFCEPHDSLSMVGGVLVTPGLS